MDKNQIPSGFDDGPSTSGPSSIQGPLNETGAPPMFSQYTEADFPNVGELPVPNVSPMTAHVITLFPLSRLIQVSSCYSTKILCFIWCRGICHWERGRESSRSAAISGLCWSTIYPISHVTWRILPSSENPRKCWEIHWNDPSASLVCLN